MLITCEKCQLPFDDAVCWTVCPHERFISPENAAQKDAGMKLLGKRVRFAHMKEAAGFVNSMGHDGMVTLETLSGEFAPHVFVVMEP